MYKTTKSKVYEYQEEEVVEVVDGTGELSPWPSYIQDRITLFDKLYTEYQEYLNTRERKPIQVSSSYNYT